MSFNGSGSDAACVDDGEARLGYFAQSGHRADGSYVSSSINRYSADRDTLVRYAAPSTADGIATRAFDIVFAVVVLLAALPFLVLVAVALQIGSPGRLFFIQNRVGKGGALFPCIKFRTMCEDADAVLMRHLAESPAARREWEQLHKLRDDPRVTRLGALVRKLSIDEFPQLINILLGQMSVVGPRPIVPAEAARYGRSFQWYCAVKPGLTGLWQVSGRNDVSYPRRVAMDRYYVMRKSLALDLQIVLRTLPSVLFAKGSY